MIQRKQSLFLLAVVIIAVLMVFIPFLTVNIGVEEAGLSLLTGIRHSEFISGQIYVPLILNLLVVAVALITIFLYKNRVLQYKLANLVVLLNVFVTGMFFLLDFFKETTQVHFAIGAFLPLAGAVMAFLAGHFIKKDEQLVRSADRIR